VTVANAVSTGDVVRRPGAGAVIANALRGLFKYLRYDRYDGYCHVGASKLECHPSSGVAPHRFLTKKLAR